MLHIRCFYKSEYPILIPHSCISCLQYQSNDTLGGRISGKQRLTTCVKEQVLRGYSPIGFLWERGTPRVGRYHALSAQKPIKIREVLGQHCEATNSKLPGLGFVNQWIFKRSKGKKFTYQGCVLTPITIAVSPCPDRKWSIATKEDQQLNRMCGEDLP